MNKEFGLQLYSVRDAMEADYMGTLEKVASYGYRTVEFAGYGGYSAEQLKEKLDSLGIQAISTHIGVEQFEGQALVPSMQFLKKLDCPFAMVPWYDTGSMENLQKLAEVLNTAAQVAAQYGVTVGYHNHGHDFKLIDGVSALERLIDMTDDAVCIELDVFWAAHAGVDVAAFVEKHAARIGLLHLKQLDSEKNSVDLADGVLDMQALCKMAREKGIDRFIVEQEAYAVSSMVSAEKNAKYLQEIL